MSFPLSPTNNQQTIVNGISYAYNASNNTWKRVPVLITGSDPLAGNTANAAFAQANSANVLAQAAYDKANTPSGITYTSSATVPSSPKTGDQWYYTTNDILYEYITDGTTSFWIDVGGPTITSTPVTTPSETLSPFLLMGA